MQAKSIVIKQNELMGESTEQIIKLLERPVPDNVEELKLV
jgi:hypothetical protein